MCVKNDDDLNIDFIVFYLFYYWLRVTAEVLWIVIGHTVYFTPDWGQTFTQWVESNPYGRWMFYHCSTTLFWMTSYTHKYIE